MSVPVAPLITDSLDYVWARVRGRMDGLTDEEYLWEPARPAWSVKPVGGGRWEIEREGDPEPAPVTTIAWRMWHIAVECLDGYSRRAFDGAHGVELEGHEWVGTAAEALSATDAAWAAFRGGVGTLDEEGMARKIGPDFGPYAEDSYAALILHAHDEIVHHGAEIALLRDLWRYR